MAKKPAAKKVEREFEGEEFRDIRTVCDRRLLEMRTTRSSLVTTWRELSDNIHPQRGRFTAPPVPNAPKGQQRQQAIIDRIATQGIKRLASFLLAGICSPARPWFRMDISDPNLSENSDVKAWMAECTDRMLEVLAASNFYGAMAQTFEEIPTFGTSAMIVLQDYNDVVRFYNLTAGEYFISIDERLQVNTLFREYLLTVEQIVAEFGIENVSDSVKMLHDNNQLGREINVVQAIYPNSKQVPGQIGWRGMPFISVQYEYGRDSDHCLRVKGFHQFSGVAPRWDVVANDIYGHGPGEETLPDVKTLQKLHTWYGMVIAKRANPPLLADSTMQGSLMDLTPGGVSFVAGLGPNSGMRSVYDVNHDMQGILTRIQDVRKAILDALYNDLITMFSQGDGPQMTAEEVRAKSQEKMLLLGPMLERFHGECLTPVIEILFDIMTRGKLLRPAPKALQGRHITPQYVSLLAQAQRAVGTSAIEGLLKFVGSEAAVSQGVLDVVDFDQLLREYADLIGTKPDTLKSPDAVAAIRKARADQANQQAQQQQMQAAMQGAQTASQIDVGGGKNALQAMLGTQ